MGPLSGILFPGNGIGGLFGYLCFYPAFFSLLIGGSRIMVGANKKREGRTAFPRGGLKQWPDIRGAVYPETFVCPYR